MGPRATKPKSEGGGQSHEVHCGGALLRGPPEDRVLFLAGLLDIENYGKDGGIMMPKKPAPVSAEPSRDANDYREDGGREC